MPKKPRDRWPELRKLVSVDDGLVTRVSGPWAEDKLWFWNRYVEITTTAMTGKFPLIYVDLFSGPGVCQIKSTSERLPGSPLIAAHAPKPFEKILLCELNSDRADACEQRLQQTAAKDRFEMFRGDCNRMINEIVTRIPQNALTLGFLDPTGLHADIETICKLADCGRVDLLILFPDAVDAVRNVEYTYLPRPDSNLDRVFGRDSNWRAEWQQLGSTDGASARRWFAQFYQRQLAERAGYRVFGEEPIQGPHGPLYRLIFASKHPLGLEFWNKISKRERRGQKRLDL